MNEDVLSPPRIEGGRVIYAGMVKHEVVLSGGPFSGRRGEEWGWPDSGPSISGMGFIHGVFPDFKDTYYAPARFDAETFRWVRRHVSTRTIETVEAESPERPEKI